MAPFSFNELKDKSKDKNYSDLASFKKFDIV
jgi:hypothetical protein